MNQIDSKEYFRRIQELVDQGMEIADAQDIVDAQMVLTREEIYSPFVTINS